MVVEGLQVFPNTSRRVLTQPLEGVIVLHFTDIQIFKVAKVVKTFVVLVYPAALRNS